MADYKINENGVDREATADEIKEIKAREIQAEKDKIALQKLEEEKANAKKSAEDKLAKLGLTTDDLKALGF